MSESGVEGGIDFRLIGRLREINLFILKVGHSKCENGMFEETVLRMNNRCLRAQEC